MDFSAAVLAHVNWKWRFLAHVEGHKKLDPAVVERDDACELGKWILKNQHLSHLAEYGSLKQWHSEFHRVAGAALRCSAGLPVEKAKLLVESSDEYKQASARCVNAITAIRDRVAKT